MDKIYGRNVSNAGIYTIDKTRARTRLKTGTVVTIDSNGSKVVEKASLKLNNKIEPNGKCVISYADGTFNRFMNLANRNGKVIPYREKYIRNPKVQIKSALFVRNVLQIILPSKVLNAMTIEVKRGKWVKI